MIDRVDLLVMSVKAPLTDAICATVCSRWREASDLWLDVIRVPRYRALSACCGLEATLKAGLYDVAQYFHVGIDEHPFLREFLTEPWRHSLPIRRDRARFYTVKTEGQFRRGTRSAAQQLVDLRLYREAIREIFMRRLYQTDPGASVAMLATCYFALGEHEALIALHGSQRWHFRGHGVRSMLQNAKACRGRAELGIVENVLEFTRNHPAGALLAPILESPEPMLATDG